ncbi:MAG: hypothetical protein IKO25_08540 [Clostridia bacterium]|nr:hypothetical protein [Clostridia bacterium]
MYHLLLFCLLYNFVIYACEATYLSQRSRKPYVLSARIPLAGFFAADAAGCVYPAGGGKPGAKKRRYFSESEE